MTDKLVIDPKVIQERLEEIGWMVQVALTQQSNKQAVCRVLLRNVPDGQDFLTLSATILSLLPGFKTISMHRLSNGNVAATVIIRVGGAAA